MSDRNRSLPVRATGRGEVWKFPLPLARGPVYEVPMPVGATVLTVQNQYGSPTLWALVSPSADVFETRTFRIVGTGIDDVRAGDEYVATVQLGTFVWHVWEVAA